MHAVRSIGYFSLNSSLRMWLLRANVSAVAFEIHGGKIPVAKVYLTSTGEKVYGGPRRDRMICELYMPKIVCINIAKATGSECTGCCD